MKDIVRLSVGSDFHVNHQRNRAEYILANLNISFSTDKHLSTIKIIFLAGDFFDDLLPLNHEDVPLIHRWIARFLRLCHKHGVIVRILEGTPSHDRKQSRFFDSVHEVLAKRGVAPEMKYVQELCVEYIEALDMRVLYVPDEWRHDVNETLQEAKDAIAAAGWDQVDVSIMHGMFTYQAPAAALKKLPLHNEEEYLALTKYLIFIGHVHLHSRYKNIIAQGSFDRISHGEEGPKGFVTATLYPDGNHEATFIENANARKFISIPCFAESVEDNLINIDKAVEVLPAGSFIRIISEYTNPILNSLSVLQTRWPQMHWTTPKVQDRTTVENTSVAPTASRYVPINIDRHNLWELLIPRLAKLGVDDSIMKICAANIAEMQNIKV